MINVELWQKGIAQVVGLSKGHVSEIVNKKSSETEHEPTIKTTSGKFAGSSKVKNSHEPTIKTSSVFEKAQGGKKLSKGKLNNLTLKPN